MTALTENYDYRQTKHWWGILDQIPVAGSTTIYHNGIVAQNTSGYAVPASNTAGYKVVGIALEGADNSSGSNGDIDVKIMRGVLALFTTSGATQASEGKIVYVTDDNTVALTPNTTNAKAGICIKYVSATSIWVFFPGIDGLLPNVGGLTIDGIELDRLRAADYAALGISETAGDHYLSLSTNVVTLLGEVANAGQKVSVSYLPYRIPNNYEAADTFVLRLKHTLTGAGTAVVSTIDVNAYEQTSGAVGSDICATAAATIVKGTWTETDFTITATGLAPGDNLLFKITTDVTETATANIQAQIDSISVVYTRNG